MATGLPVTGGGVLRMALAALCLAAVPACATPIRYSAEPIEAWVVDAETKQPLDGVVVTANWQLKEGTFGGSVQVGQLMVAAGKVI